MFVEGEGGEGGAGQVDTDVVAALTSLVGFDVATADDTTLGRACGQARRVRGWLDAFDAAAARRSDQLKQAGQGRGAESMLTRHGRLSQRQARHTTRRAGAIADAPALGDALAAGAVSAGHVDAFAAAADRASPAGRAALVDQQQSLASRAAAQTPEEFGVACRRIVALADDDGGVGEFERQRRATRLRRWIDDGTGMFRLAGEFDPELGVRLWRAIDHTIGTNYPAGQHPDSTPDGPDAHDHLAALALADLATAAYADPTPATAVPAHQPPGTTTNPTPTSDPTTTTPSGTPRSTPTDSEATDQPTATSSSGASAAAAAPSDPSPNDDASTFDSPTPDMCAGRSPAGDGSSPTPSTAGTEAASTAPSSTAPSDRPATDPPLAVTAEPRPGTSPRPGGVALRRPPRGEFSVVIDLDTLIHGLHERSIVEVDPGGVSLPVDTLRRLACEADLLPIVLDGPGVAVDVGRAKRLATADQRRALRAMYPRCALSDCTVEFDHCQIHHLDPYAGATNGDTNLSRLVPLCNCHHHAAHEGHWQLHLDPITRILTVTLPDGTTHTHPPPRLRPG